MSYINECTLMGNLGADPVLKTHKEGLISCRFSLATTENNNTSWHNVIAWGKLAEVIHHYMEKGDKLYVRGRIRYYKYKNKDGVLVYKTEIVAQSIKIIRTKKFIESDPPAEVREAIEAAEAVGDTTETPQF